MKPKYAIPSVPRICPVCGPLIQRTAPAACMFYHMPKPESRSKGTAWQNSVTAGKEQITLRHLTNHHASVRL